MKILKTVELYNYKIDFIEINEDTVCIKIPKLRNEKFNFINTTKFFNEVLSYIPKKNITINCKDDIIYVLIDNFLKCNPIIEIFIEKIDKTHYILTDITNDLIKENEM